MCHLYALFPIFDLFFLTNVYILILFFKAICLLLLMIKHFLLKPRTKRYIYISLFRMPNATKLKVNAVDKKAKSLHMVLNKKLSKMKNMP